MWDVLLGRHTLAQSERTYSTLDTYLAPTSEDELHN
jgi:hypothetical protein